MYGPVRSDPVRSGPVRSNFSRTVTFWWNFQNSEILHLRGVKYFRIVKTIIFTHTMIADISLAHFQHITNLFQICLLKSEFWICMIGSVRSGPLRSGPVWSGPVHFFFRIWATLVLTNSHTAPKVRTYLYKRLRDFCSSGSEWVLMFAYWTLSGPGFFV